MKLTTVLKAFGNVSVKNVFIPSHAAKKAFFIASHIAFTPFLNHSHFL